MMGVLVVMVIIVVVGRAAESEKGIVPSKSLLQFCFMLLVYMPLSASSFSLSILMSANLYVCVKDNIPQKEFEAE